MAAVVLAGSLAQAQRTERASVDNGWVQGNDYSSSASLSADGRFVAFQSKASNFIAGDNDSSLNVFVRDRQTGTLECIDVTPTGSLGNGESNSPSISADGRWVAFMSTASNLVAGDLGNFSDVFVRDRLGGTTERISLAPGGTQPNNSSAYPAISADGRFVVFWSGASNLVAGDTNALIDVFVRDRLNGTTERVSVDSNGVQANGVSFYGSLSADGRFVSFVSPASNLVPGDTNGVMDLFVHDRLAGATTRVSVDSAGAQGDLASGGIASPGDRNSTLSADGRFVVFESHATNLVAGDTNGAGDVFVHDNITGTTERVSVDSSGLEGNAFSDRPAISADGRFVAFQSVATNLVAGDTNTVRDVFLHDRLTGGTERQSLSSSGVAANWDCSQPVVSGNGRVVAFSSRSTTLVQEDVGSLEDVFLRERNGAPLPPAFCFGDGSAGACPCGNNGATGKGCENSSGTGGALLSSAGNASLSADTFWLRSAGQVSLVTSLFLQGSAAISAVSFGDGLRCAGGTLVRLYVRSAPPGSVSTAPLALEPSISARSAARGDAISAGSTRYYQVYYRDPILGFCPSPQGNSWNISSGLAVVWGQ